MTWVRRTALSILLGMLFFALPLQSQASAQGVDDFTITSFSADYQLTNEHPQGELTVTEAIELDFRGQNRGILRSIPLVYGERKVHPEIIDIQRDGATEPYQLSEQGDNLVLRIGDPDVFITGEHSYEIRYRVEDVIRFYDTHDELFWDVNGTQWGQPFLAVSAQLNSAAPLASSKPAQCFSGAEGSTAQDCSVEVNRSGVEFRAEDRLDPGQTLSIVAGFEKGYFTPKSWLERNWRVLVAAVIAMPQLFVIHLAYKKWRAEGKDHGGRGVQIPYYTRPKGVSVLTAHYVANSTLRPRHVSAAIIDLAVRGFITIHESGPKRKPKHTLTLTDAPRESLHPEEQLLIQALFASSAAGSSVSIEEKANKLHTALQHIKKESDKQARAMKLYDISPRQKAGAFKAEYGLGALVVVAGLMVSNLVTLWALIPTALTFVALVLFGTLMTRRSQLGERVKEHVHGIEHYIEVAEKDRYKALQAVAAPLAKDAGEPKRTVDLFEKLLPFAVAAGIETTWAEAFSGIYSEPPQWYQGNWSGFSSVALANHLSTTTTSINTSFTPPSSSSGSGFSGGGSAGGGGGGGGGGGW